jgi:predicted RNA-binding Zn-ribbon protein involved in translation (DUF1610 family)
MTPAEHQARHQELHRMMDELAADYLAAHRGADLTTTLRQLMQWSHQQTQTLTHDDHGEASGALPAEGVEVSWVCPGCGEVNIIWTPVPTYTLQAAQPFECLSCEALYLTRFERVRP